MFQRKTTLTKRPTQHLHGKSIFNEWKFLILNLTKNLWYLRNFLETNSIGLLNNEFFDYFPNGNDVTNRDHYGHYYQLKPPNSWSRTSSLPLPERM